MNNGLNGLRRGICICCVVLAPMHLGSQERRLPTLGYKVPAYLVKASKQSHQCLTSTNRYDPCASVKIDNKIFKIAWDAKSNVVTYIFTKDPAFTTDSELGTGGSCRLVDEFGRPDTTIRYLGWLTSTMWRDTNTEISGDAVWYALLRRQNDFPQYGEIVGFVQSRYLKTADNSPVSKPRRGK